MYTKTWQRKQPFYDIFCTFEDMARTSNHYENKMLRGDNSIHIQGMVMVLVHWPSTHCHLSIKFHLNIIISIKFIAGQGAGQTDGRIKRHTNKQTNKNNNKHRSSSSNIIIASSSIRTRCVVSDTLSLIVTFKT